MNIPDHIHALILLGTMLVLLMIRKYQILSGDGRTIINNKFVLYY